MSEERPIPLAAIPRLSIALALAQRVITAQSHAAVIVLSNEGDDALRTVCCPNYDTVSSQTEFEAMAGKTAASVGANRAVLVFHNRADDQDYLSIFSVDVEDGLDLARCKFDRTDLGVVFGDVEMLTGRYRLDAQAPGRTLLNALLDANPTSK